MARTTSKSKSKSAEVMDVDEDQAAVQEVEEVEGEEEQVADGEEGEEEEEEGEGEYEVQAILDHKQKAGKFNYLVSWKGYGPEHNTWEPEEHVSHSEVAVSAYWNAKPKTTIKSKADEPVKRARPSAAQRPAKQQKTNGTPAKPKPQEVEAEEDEESFKDYDQSHIDSTDKYKDIESWEDLVQSVDTIERGPKNTLVVYLTMSGGEKVAQAPEIVYKRCPQKILQFYESHLKWRNVEAA